MSNSVKNRRERSVALIVTIAVCIVAVVVSFLSVMHSIRLERSVSRSLDYSHTITEKFYTLNKCCLEMRLFVCGSMNGIERSTEDMNIMYSLEKKAIDSMEYIIKNFDGDDRLSTALMQALDSLINIQRDFISYRDEITLFERELFVSARLVPLYSFLSSTIDNMKTYVADDVDKSIQMLGKSVNFIWVTVAILLLSGVFFAFLYRKQRLKLKQNYIKSKKEEQFALICNNIDDVFLVYCPASSEVEFVSENSKRRLGIDVQELKRDVMTLFSFCNREQIYDIMDIFRGSKFISPMEKECQILNPVTNEWVWSLITVYSITDSDDAKKYILAIADLSAEKRSQEILRDALISAQNANKAKSNFLSRMSHEIRTPMNAIIGMTSIAMYSSDDKARLMDALSKIDSSSKHMLSIINDILDTSKIESGNMELEEKPFSIKEVVAEARDMIAAQALAKSHNLETIISLTTETVIGDPMCLRRVLINILSNAVRYTPENGTIKFTIKETKTKIDTMTVRFIVSDTGIGMSTEFLGRIFLPFEQEGRIGSGTGLGMTITKNIIDQMGGSIHVQSEIDKGSTFTVELTFKVDENEAELTILDNMKVLILDDATKDERELISRVGVRTKWAKDTQTAFQALEEARNRREVFDIFIICLDVPGVDGPSLVKIVRERFRKPCHEIVFCGKDWEMLEQESRISSITGTIKKPLIQSMVYNTLLEVGTNLKEVEPDNDLSDVRVLVAEDNDINREIAEALLTNMNASVESVCDGQKALEAFKASEPGYYDLILMDVQMPVLNGHQATKKIRLSNHPDALTIPIIAMTANAFAQDVATASHAGMNAHLAKPVDSALLLKTILEQIGR